MRMILLMAFVGIGCVEPIPEYVVAPDPEPEVCDGENYPFEAPPDTCESNSYGTCCSWYIDNDAGSCRYDYCTYHESDCEWTLTHEEC